MRSELRAADLLWARMSSAFKLGGRRMGEQDTEFMAMPRRRNFNGRMERGGYDFVMMLDFEAASSRGEGTS